MIKKRVGFSAALAGLAGATLVACGNTTNYAPSAYVPTQLEAICVDRYQARVDPVHCSVGYGPDRDGFTWEYADVGAGEVDLPYYGSRVPSGWSRQRPINITNITIVQPTAQTTRPPGTKATSVKVPKATATPKPVATTTKATVQRGGLGVKTSPKSPPTTTKRRAN